MRKTSYKYRTDIQTFLMNVLPFHHTEELGVFLKYQLVLFLIACKKV